MIDWNKPIRTKDGRAVRVLCTDRMSPTGYPVLALIKDSYGNETVQFYTIEGKYHKSGSESTDDLENAPAVKSLWVNVYPDDAYGYRSRDEADFRAADNRVSLLRLDIQDGTLTGVHDEG